MGGGRGRWTYLLAAMAVLLLALAAVWLRTGGDTPAPAATPVATPAASRSAAGSATAISGAISRDRLPPEAQSTLRLIQQGGPFPYRQDGAVFENRERRLPSQPSGYYREYTVVTPGSPDRGARRIVTGRGGEIYYTDDHYDSFRRVTP